MRLLRQLAPAAVLTALLGVVCLQGAVPAAATKATKAVPIEITDCGKAAASPTEVTLTCADGNTVLRYLDWWSFGRGAAKGSGRLEMNTCTPNCVEGQIVRYEVTVKAGDPTSCPGGERVYDKLSLTFTAPAPRVTRGLRHWTLGCPLE